MTINDVVITGSSPAMTRRELHASNFTAVVFAPQINTATRSPGAGR
jgi:hypothetical protein